MLAGAHWLVASCAILTACLGCRENVYIGLPRGSGLTADADGASVDARDAGPDADAEAQAPFPWYLHAIGSKIADSNDNEVVLHGINWSGMETTGRVPGGLNVRPLENIITQIETLGFNLIRIPFASDAVAPDSMPGQGTGGDPVSANPSLEGLTSLEVLDHILDVAAAHHLRLVLDRYRFRSTSGLPPPSLWYSGPDPSSTVGGGSEQQWIDDWIRIAQRYVTRPNFVGCDLHDEPGGAATWGDGNPSTDFRLAAERAGNAILGVNSSLLILVEGIESVGGQSYWPGGNLRGARALPVRLTPSRQLAYSIHDYGKDVKATASWFTDPTFPDNLVPLWSDTWGYLVMENTSPVIIGAFGDRKDEPGISADDAAGDVAWRGALAGYIAANQLSYAFWALNPSSEGKRGLLSTDWRAPDPAWSAFLGLQP